MNRDDIVSQLPAVRKKFPTYKEFAEADIHKIFPEKEMSGALVLHANNFKSCYLKNNGNGKFEMQPLPDAAQTSAINGMVVDDFNGDGNLDIAIIGNDYGNEVFNGRYDAMNGLVLLGNGNGSFVPQSILQSGFFVPYDAKALVKLKSQDNGYLLAASQNRGPLKIFRLKPGVECLALQNGEMAAQVKFRNGKSRRQEFYYGSSFLSQSSRFLELTRNVASVIFYNNKGETRRINY
jgi:hypothetical protein